MKNVDSAELALYLTLVNGTLHLLGTTRSVLSSAQRAIRLARLKEFPTPRALQHALVRREVEPGNTVKVNGFVSRYSHLHRPISFLNSRLDSARMASMAQRLGISRGGPGLAVAHLASQNAISSLPAFRIGEHQVRCLFLYSSAHDRFLYSRPQHKDDDLKTLQIPPLEPRIAIPEHAWPVPVLLPTETALAIAERRVRLTAVVRELPLELSQRFQTLYAKHVDKRTLSNFMLLPGEPSLSYCLSLLPEDQDTGFNHEATNASPVDRSLLYVEGHVEGDSVSLDMIAEALHLPELGYFSQQSFTETAAVFPVLLKLDARPSAVEGERYRVLAGPDDVTINLKAPNIFGFYAETTPARNLSARVQDLASIWSRLDDGVASTATKLGRPMQLALDFLFDFDRQAMFDTKGVLTSDRALQALHEDDELRSTADWLRGR